MPKLHIVPPIAAPDTPKTRAKQRRAADERPAAMIQCPRCGGREITETRIGALVKNGRLSGGTRVHICTACFMNGERVVLA